MCVSTHSHTPHMRCAYLYVCLFIHTSRCVSFHSHPHHMRYEYMYIYIYISIYLFAHTSRHYHVTRIKSDVCIYSFTDLCTHTCVVHIYISTHPHTHVSCTCVRLRIHTHITSLPHYIPRKHTLQCVAALKSVLQRNSEFTHPSHRCPSIYFHIRIKSLCPITYFHPIAYAHVCM